MKQSVRIDKIDFMTCQLNYGRETGKKPETRLHENQCARNLHGEKSQILMRIFENDVCSQS